MCVKLLTNNFLLEKAIGKSKDVHLAVLRVLPEVIRESVDADASSKSVIIYDPATGEKKMVSPTAVDGIESLGEVKTAEQTEAEINARMQDTIQRGKDWLVGNVANPVGMQIQLGDGRIATIEAMHEDGKSAIATLPDGTQFLVSKDVLQRIVNNGQYADYKARRDAEAGKREAEQSTESAPETATEGGQPLPEEASTKEEESREYAQGDVFDVVVNGNKMHAEIVSPKDADGRFVVNVDDGESMRTLYVTPEELAAMEYREEPSTKAEETRLATEDSSDKALERGAQPTEEHAPTALERIPRDEKGNAQFHDVDTETAWDGLVEMSGNEETAHRVAEASLANAEKKLKAAKALKEKGEKSHREEAAKAEAERIATEKAEAERKAAEERERAEAEEEARVEAERKAEEERKTEEEERKERDENGQPFVVSSDGTTTFGEITEDTGLTAAPIKLSEGFQDANTGKGYGLVHIEANHGEQIRQAGFTSVKEFVSFVATHYDPDNIRVGKRRDDGSDTFLIQVTDTHDNTLFIELSKDGSYWNVNSGGIFRKGYSNKKETVAKTEPQQPTNAVSSDSSLSANVKDGITNAEPNGEPTVSLDKGTTLPADQQTSDKENTKKVADSEGENTLKAKIEAASADVNTEPTEAQKKAGNYKKGHVQVGTFDITIEQPEGSIRRGTDADGKQWESKMHNTYGYFRGTEGVDGDHIDVFLSNDIDGWNGRKVFVVDQYNPDGTFDEHKVMLGFNDMDEAKSDYLANYEKGWENGRRIDVSATNLKDFEKWIDSSHRKTKPFSEYSSVNKGSEKAEKKQKKQSVFDKAKEIADKEEKKRKAEAEDDSVLGQATRAVGKKKKVNLFKYTASKKISIPVLRGVHYANGYAYASDGYILFKEKADYPKEWEGTTRDKDGNLIDGKYPDTEKAIHRLVHIPDKEVESLPSKEVLDFAIAASKKLKGEAIPVAIDGIFFNAVNLKKFLEAVASKGMDKVVYRHPMLYATNGKDEIVMMPTVNTLEGALDIADKMESAGLPKEQIDAWKAHIEAADKKKSFDDFKKAVENAKKEGVRPTEADKQESKAEADKTKQKPLTEAERKDAEEVAGALGYRVEWVDTMKGTIDADKKVIRIAKDAENPLVQVLGHEVTHGVKRMDGGKFKALQKAAMEVVGEKEWNERIEKKRKLNAYAEGKLAEEVTCDIVGEALNDKDALKRLAESLRGEKGILARLRDAVARMVEYFKNRGDKEGVRRMKAADRLLAEFESALKEGVAPEQVKPEGVDRSVRSSKEMDEERLEIERKAKSDGTWLKAPNGKRTNLNERQWVDVRTKNFKEWFGDWENDPENASKIVDENGEPLMVFHYTWEDFTIFGEGKEIGASTFYNASDANYAATAAIGDWFTSESDLSDDMGKPMKVFLNIKNPSDGYSLEVLADEVGTEIRAKDYEAFDEDRDNTAPIIEAGKNYQEKLINKGYDGIFIADEEFGGTSYITFAPNQIKSAVENDGSYSPKKNDIRRSVREGRSEKTELTAEERELRDNLVERMRKGGLDVVTDSEEMQRVIDTENERTRMMGAGSVREHRVYHGSGADFDAFDHSHMGEGEGAQAYGWGTYVTEVEGIGRTYAIQNTTKHNDALRALQHDVDAISDQLNRHRDDLKYDEEQLKRANEWRAEAELDYELFKDEAEELKEKYGEASPEYRNHLFNDIYTDEMKRAQSSVKSMEESIQYRKEKIAELGKALKDKQAEIDELPKEFPRHLYTIEIPDDNGSNYLDWNSSLSKEQKDTITKALKRLKVDLTYYESRGFSLDDTFADIYYFLTIALRHTRKWEDVNAIRASSKFLYSLGFTGIKYPADNTRGGREDGAKNYVIFNENDAKITDHTRFLRTADGEVYGLVKDGRIYLDPKVATAETAVHEYMHLWGDMLRRKDSEQWSHTVKELKDSVLWEEVKELYPELKTDDEIADEVLSTFSGRRGAERLREEARRVADGEGGVFTKAKAIETLERVKEAIARFWEGVARMFGINRYRSVEELADMAMRDLINGVKPTSRTFTFDNFYKDTKAVFEGTERPKGKPDYISYSGSEYWYGEDKGGKYVVRGSDHWSGEFKVKDGERTNVGRNHYSEITEDGMLPIGAQGSLKFGWKKGLSKPVGSGISAAIDRRGSGDSNNIASCYWYIDNAKEKDNKGFTYGKAYLSEFEDKERRRDIPGDDWRDIQGLEGGTRAMAVKKANDRFNEELEMQVKGELEEGHVYKLGMPSEILLSTGVPNLPIELSAKQLSKKAANRGHRFDVKDIANLPQAIQAPIAVFEYGNKDKSQNLIVEIERDGKKFVVGIHFNQNRRGIVVNDIRGLFNKDSHEWLNWISQGKLLYADKEKIQALIDKQRTNLAEVNYLNLDDVAKKVKDFENPKLLSVKISEVDKKGSDSTDRSVRENPKNEDKPRYSRKPGESIFDYASRVSEDVDRSVRERVSARDEYEKKVKSKGFQTKEALQNSMLGLQEFMYAIDHASGNRRYIEDIPDFENPILGENRLSSVNKEEMHQVAKTQFKPLMSAVAKLSGNGKESGELYDYMFAKHGLERDAVMRQREAQKEFDKYQKANPKGTKTIGDFVASLEGKDYAGLTALTAEDGRVKSIQSQIDAIDEQMKATDDQLLLRKLGGQKKRLKVDLLNAARDAADDIRKAFESDPNHDRSDINELWSRVNEVNGNTLRKLYESGMLTKEAYNDISSMYTNYIPMRGFDQTTSADAYAYLTHGDSAFNAPIKTAKGRSSKADNPIAYMQAMAESAIMQGNRNVLVKQKMLNFVRNHPSDLASVSDVWLQYDSVADEWKPFYAFGRESKG